MENNNLTSKRFKARYLIVVKGMMQKDVAEKVGVSVVTICNWNRKYKWTDQAEKEIKIQVVFDEFKAYLKKCDSSLAQKVSIHLESFINRLKKRL